MQLRELLASTRHWITTSSPEVLYDRQLVWIALGLMLTGLVMVTSASFPISTRLTDQPFHFMFRHAVFLLLALVTASIVLQVPLSKWSQYGSLLLGLSVFLLIVVLVAGKSVNGASRWIPLGLFNLQPAELAKLSLFIFMSGYLVRKHQEVRSSFFGGFIKPIIIFGTLASLLLLQPDLGTVIVMLVTLFGMLFIAGAKLSQFLALMAVGIFSVVALILLEPYRVRRVTSFLDPWEDPFGSGYQLTQSLMAFGRGEWLGQGLGNSIQKLEYLPEAHTDFVFAVLAEELGFVGVVLVLMLIFSLVIKAILIGRKAFENDVLFGGYLAFGIGIWFAFQTLVNVGAAAGMVPTKGLTLPLISYGGSSLIIMTVAVAILLRVDFECRISSMTPRPKKIADDEKNKRLMVMAGGTGGHVFPGLAVAKKLQQQGWDIRWLGTADRMEAELVPKHGIEIDFIKVKGLRGQGILKLIQAPFQIVNAVLQARKHIKAWQPDVVLGMGGYVSGPGGVAARIQGIPVVLHEQNAVAGLTNRWLSWIAAKVFQAFPGAFPDAEVVGNPVREDVVAIRDPSQRMGGRTDNIRILVMGGSQGAQVLNRTMPEVMAKLGVGYEVRHQAGKNNKAEVESQYHSLQVESAQIVEFIEDVAEAYAWADILICRSGALTVSEVAAAGLGAIFVPFMHKDRQQALNADHLVECGAAKMIEQPELTVDKLAQQIQQLDRHKLIEMANSARSVARLDADDKVANAIIALTN